MVTIVFATLMALKVWFNCTCLWKASQWYCCSNKKRDKVLRSNTRNSMSCHTQSSRIFEAQIFLKFDQNRDCEFIYPLFSPPAHCLLCLCLCWLIASCFLLTSLLVCGRGMQESLQLGSKTLPTWVTAADLGVLIDLLSRVQGLCICPASSVCPHRLSSHPSPRWKSDVIQQAMRSVTVGRPRSALEGIPAR